MSDLQSTVIFGGASSYGVDNRRPYEKLSKRDRARAKERCERTQHEWRQVVHIESKRDPKPYDMVVCNECGTDGWRAP